MVTDERAGLSYHDAIRKAWDRWQGCEVIPVVVTRRGRGRKPVQLERWGVVWRGSVVATVRRTREGKVRIIRLRAGSRVSTVVT